MLKMLPEAEFLSKFMEWYHPAAKYQEKVSKVSTLLAAAHLIGSEDKALRGLLLELHESTNEDGHICLESAKQILDEISNGATVAVAGIDAFIEFGDSPEWRALERLKIEKDVR